MIGMNQDNRGVLLNRINIVLPDHIMWIKSQFKKRKFIQTRGREVLIDVPKSNLKRIVNIPSKDDPGYINSWVKVYNYSLDYLEGALNAACLENRFIKREGNYWTLNGKPIVWPKFNAEDALYAKNLEDILDEYTLIKNSYIEALNKQNNNISFRKSSVMLKPADKVSVSQESVEKPVEEVSIPQIPAEKPIEEVSKSYNLLKIQKISDGDAINSRDVNTLINQKTDLVILTCQDINNPKEEDLFLRNADICQKAGLNIGAFIYGKATDEHMGAIELKRIIKMFNKFDNSFSRFVVYSINSEYIIKNRNSDIKLLDFINVYNAILNTLKKAGYTAMLSMDVASAKIINDINRRFNMQNEHDVIYMAVVRDIDEISEDASLIVVDPGNDYDIVNIKNKRISDELSSYIDKGLVKSI